LGISPPAWSHEHALRVRKVKKKKKHVKALPCLCIINPLAFLIVEIDASDIGYGGMLE
jgi:hypothetical protein